MRAILSGGRRQTAAVRLSILVAAALGTSGVSASPAAADYAVVQCVPGSQGYAEAAWTPFGSTGFSVWGNNECAVGYGLRLDTNYNGAPTGWTGNGSGLAWRFTAPYATSFTSASASLHYGDNGGYAAAYFSDGTPPFAVPDGGDGAPSLWTTASVTNARIFEIRLQCFAVPNCHSNWSYVWATQFVGVVRDESAPGVTASGPLLDGEIVHGVKSLKATASDAGGGARLISVYVNGLLSKQADLCPPDYQGAYTHLVPCPGSYTEQFAINTEKDPGWVDGANDVAICATDVGGNGSACVKRTVMADNSCPGSGGAGASALDAGVEAKGRLADRAVIKSTDQAVVRGALRDGNGDPVADATVCIYQTVDLPDASRELAAKVTTRSNGRFATVLDPGPSRKLDLIYRQNDRILDDSVELDSKVVPTLKVPRRKRHVHNGEATRFKGRLPGPNADGRAVALQARAGRKWRTFKQLRTDSEGHFHGKYRFVHTTGRQLYLFRVVVKSQGGYPYEPGHSQKRKVIVRG